MKSNSALRRLKPPSLKNSPRASFRLSVDPGLRGTGLAFWSERDWARCCCPTRVVNVYASVKTDWISRAWSLAENFERELKRQKVTHVYMEFPQFFGSSAKGLAAARRGDLARLLFVVGMLATVCHKRGIAVTLIEVNLWKGQLTKVVVTRRIKTRLPLIARLKVLSHSWDAVGIGLFAKGFFKARSFSK